MGYGFRPLVINWMESRLLKVVFPDDDGPEINTSFTRVPFSPRWKMLSAICAIFFSCRASATLIRSVACPSSQAILKSPTLFNPMM